MSEEQAKLNFAKFKYTGAGYAVIERADGDSVEKLHTPEICGRAAAEIERLTEVERQYLKAEAHLPEGFRYGLVSATFDLNQARLVARRGMDDARLSAEKAEAEASRRYDCHGGPGMSEPFCGGCVSCLTRELDAKEKR